MIETNFTRMFGLRHAIAQAGMGGVARAELVERMTAEAEKALRRA